MGPGPGPGSLDFVIGMSFKGCPLTKAITQGLALAWPGLGHGLCMYRLPAENRVIMYINISSDVRCNVSGGHTMLPMGFCTSPSPTRSLWNTLSSNGNCQLFVSSQNSHKHANAYIKVQACCGLPTNLSTRLIN